MNKDKRFFSKKLIPITLVFGFLICNFADAATRASSRATPTSRKTVATTTQNVTQPKENTPVEEETTPTQIETEPITEQQKIELIISNKSNQFESIIDSVMESAGEDNSFAEQIRRQRAALAASESGASASNAQKAALASNSHTCDTGLRKCMSDLCGKDFTKCALDGDTDFGDKLNKCRKNVECSAQEFSLFGKEIKDDRDTNVRLASYNAVIDCGNNYNACIVNECGTTYSKCLGKDASNAAIKKCSIIALECQEADSGLVSRFGTAIGKLRENAEKDIKTDEERLYKLRDLMRNQCESLGAAFDERSFDCVYTVEFYAGANQSAPLASRKAYAGDSFVCTQEWFGVNTTTAQENAYRETRSQTAASSAMLGSGLGVAAGALSSGAIDRAIDTTKAKNAVKKAEKETNQSEKITEEDKNNVQTEGSAVQQEKAPIKAVQEQRKKKDLKEECKAQDGTLKNGECNNTEKKSESKNVKDEDKETKKTKQTKTENNKSSNTAKSGDDCTSKVTQAAKATYNKSLDCIVKKCNKGYHISTNNKYCIQDSNSDAANQAAVDKAQQKLTEKMSYL